jgi:CubicO group peptidase (beta-lactamase class C family)
MNQLRFILILVLFPLFSSYSQSRPDKKPTIANDNVWTQSFLAAFEKEVETLRERHHIPGLSVGIVKGKQLAWKKGFGYADVEQKIVPDEHTVYQIASVTKTFGSILLMQQVEAGKVSLDDPIAQYNINLGARWGSDERIKSKAPGDAYSHG